MIYFCAQKSRRDLVLRSALLNGIDYLEVVSDHPGCGKQLAVTFLKDARGLQLAPANVVVSGDTVLNVVAVHAATDEDPQLVIVDLDHTGDFSPYTLTLVGLPGGIDPPAGLDPQLSALTFSFKADCPSPVDCRVESCCPLPAIAPPDINYLAKDYSGFVQVMRDRMAVLVPGWNETHAADIGIAIIEALAYAADHLSYQQDAVSTEAYIGTARSRISLRRHARLVDYTVGEGCNARAWVYLETLIDGLPVPKDTAFYVRTPGEAAVVDPLDLPHASLLRNSTQPIFSSLCDARLYQEQNEIHFYTWGDSDCCLPVGATQAALVNTLGTLAVGTVLIFEEVVGPRTGSPDDADPMHRWAVRLTGVRTTSDNGTALSDPLNGQAITEVSWSSDDALPFPLCLSSTYTGDDGPVQLFDVSVARGNIVPSDHGIAVRDEVLGVVPDLPPEPQVETSCACDTETIAAASMLPPHARFYPQLAQTPLTFAHAYDASAPASAFATGMPSTASAMIAVYSDDGRTWTATEDMLSSRANSNSFVPEVEYDGSAFLRFGDGQYGEAPDPGLQFTADYRVGNGSQGNVGHDTIAHMIGNPKQIRSVRNPLAATGGVDPESMEHIRQYAPFAFQAQERCVTEDDYGTMTATFPGVRQARGSLRWTGSWYTAFVSVEAQGALSQQLVHDTKHRLNLLRMLGVDVAVEAAKIVGLDIVLRICVAPDHFRGDVYAALLKLFITGDQCGGQRGLLNADNFVFGESVYASPLIAAAQSVDGVVSATLVTFGRLDKPWVNGTVKGYIALARLEIARCDNDPNHLDRGVFALQLDGGK
ncbi:baseplate J/gp47 family protein [Dyella halodurans]|uniref:Baseplate J/gp47 family protein n=1 Tax=Dyella halodurans TaxID=1920171 RepID=A0ABV9C2H9_9GAMM|nr:baseplate J/gp47 family protein [Dyella halodurans]